MTSGCFLYPFKPSRLVQSRIVALVDSDFFFLSVDEGLDKPLPSIALSKWERVDDVEQSGNYKLSSDLHPYFITAQF